MTEIRKAAADDVPLLLPLIRDYWAFEQLPGFDAQRLSRPLSRLLSDAALGGAWLALHDGRAVGYLLAVYVFSLEHAGLTAEIDEFYVAPSGRGKGIGLTLLQEAEAAFTRLGCTNVSLQLARGNDAARRFYRRHGYAQRSGFELLDKDLAAGSQARPPAW